MEKDFETKKIKIELVLHSILGIHSRNVQKELESKNTVLIPMFTLTSHNQMKPQYYSIPASSRKPVIRNS